MKKILFVSAIIGSTFSTAAADGFTIRGEIPGMPAGTTVTLVLQDDGSKAKIAEVTGKDGAFILKGSVPSPQLCEIRLEGGDDSLGKAFELMVENTDITVSAPGFDLLPPGFYADPAGLELEKNVKVEGGRAQREYAEFKAAMFPYEYAEKEAHYNLYWKEENKEKPELRKQLGEAFDRASLARETALREFICKYPDYSISGLQYERLLRDPFVYTVEELDKLAESVAGMWDKLRLEKVNKAIEWSRAYPALGAFTDFSVLDTDGKECKLSAMMEQGKYALIDFWASWCGPCRAAIPHVRELHDTYAGKLKVFAVSMDSDEKAWRRAMDKEKMEWTQLWADKDHVKAVSDPYQIKGIPFMLLIDPKGKIVFAGHDPNVLSDYLSKNLN